MLAKHVERKKRSSFKRLARYILATKAGEQVLWTRPEDYVAELKGDSERVEVFRITNCVSEVPAWAIKEIELTQARNTRSQADKTYHLVVSFPEGEKPTREQLENIEDTICAGLGFGEHQRISAVHVNTDNVHLHMAINKIHPESFRLMSPYQAYARLDEMCRQLEQKHGLRVDNSIKRNRQPGRAGDMEAHAGEASLLRWVKEHAAEPMRVAIAQGGGWQPLHRALAALDLEIKPRGAGLTVKARRAGGPMVKPSQVDRGFAFKALTEALGPYEEPDEAVASVKPEKRYDKAPLHPAPEAAGLYSVYRQQREEAVQARKAGNEAIQAEHRRQTEDLAVRHGARREYVRRSAALTRQGKQASYSELAAERQAEIERLRAERAGRKHQLAEEQPLPTWQDFLRQEAERGNAAALAALRSRDARRQRIAFGLITAEDAVEAWHVVRQDLRSQVRKNGDVIYTTGDGGQVRDSREHVAVTAPTEAAALVALSIAAERFAGKALVVTGTEEFRRQVLQAAALPGMEVKFADEALETARRMQVSARAEQEHISAGLVAYVDARNATRERVADILPHRVWEGVDAGEAVYRGRRRFEDGTEAVLLERDGEVLVKPATAAQAAKASGWKVGQTVTTDARGRFVDGISRGRRR